MPWVLPIFSSPTTARTRQPPNAPRRNSSEHLARRAIFLVALKQDSVMEHVGMSRKLWDMTGRSGGTESL